MGQGSSQTKDTRGSEPGDDDPARLYVKCSSDTWPVIYSPDYDFKMFLGLQRLSKFDTAKWGKVHNLLIEKKMLSSTSFACPLEISKQELEKFHTKEYLESLNSSRTVATIADQPGLGLMPRSLLETSVVRPFRLQASGTILAGKLAMEHGWAINLGGGQHHCSVDKGGGFCLYADITLNIKYLWENFQDIKKVLIIDLDAHQGNGYARDFLGNEDVFIFDVYNCLIFPKDENAKKAIRRKVEIKTGATDQEYLDHVRKNITEVLDEFNPQYVLYNAGTDILKGDVLGLLNVSPEGVIERDSIIFSAVRGRNIPIVMLLSGGFKKSAARVIADSIEKLHESRLIEGPKTNVLD